MAHSPLVQFLRTRVLPRLPVPALRWLLRVRDAVVPGTSDSNPLKLLRVDPNAIEYRHDDAPTGLGRVVGGDWDLDKRPFEDNRVYRYIEESVRGGTPRGESELYRSYLASLERGEQPRGCRSVEELDALLDRIDALYHRIRTDGYRSQRSLYRAGSSQVTDLQSSRRRDTFHPVLDEVSVNVHRDGGMAISRSGAHRLSIAKILDLDEIPVLVRVRHAQWQAIRDEVRRSDSVASLSEAARTHVDHPDLRDVVSFPRPRDE